MVEQLFSGMPFDRHVRDALAHLHDLVYLQTHPLARLVPGETAASTSQASNALRRYLLEAIESLRPGDAGRRSAGVSSALGDAAAETIRRHLVLTLRYVEGLDAHAVQDRLGLSQSTYYRDHQAAVEALCSVLRERLGLAEQRAQPGEKDVQKPGDGAEPDNPSGAAHSSSVVVVPPAPRVGDEPGAAEYLR